MSIADRINERMAQLGTNAKAVARTARLGETAIYDIIKGKSKSPRTDTLQKIASALNTTPEWLATGETASTKGLPSGYFRKRVVGFVQAGLWTDSHEIPFDDQREVIVQMRDDPATQHVFMLEARGNSMNLANIKDGDTLICLPLGHYPKDLRTGEKVIAYRSRGHGEMEATVKELDIRSDGSYWLWPRSDDPLFASPIKLPLPQDWPTDFEHLDSGEVAVHAIVLGVTERAIEID